MKNKKEMLVPFSNGTEAMMWYDENCARCKKSFHPDEKKGWPKEETLKKYVSCGKYCKLQYHIDMAFITSEIPMEIAKQIGVEGEDLKWNCMMFSDNDDDGRRPPKRPKPDNTPDNQMCLPIILNEITGEKSKVVDKSFS